MAQEPTIHAQAPSSKSASKEKKDDKVQLYPAESEEPCKISCLWGEVACTLKSFFSMETMDNKTAFEYLAFDASFVKTSKTDCYIFRKGNTIAFSGTFEIFINLVWNEVTDESIAISALNNNNNSNENENENKNENESEDEKKSDKDLYHNSNSNSNNNSNVNIYKPLLIELLVRPLSIMLYPSKDSVCFEADCAVMKIDDCRHDYGNNITEINCFLETNGNITIDISPLVQENVKSGKLRVFLDNSKLVLSDDNQH